MAFLRSTKTEEMCVRWNKVQEDEHRHGKVGRKWETDEITELGKRQKGSTELAQTNEWTACVNGAGNDDDDDANDNVLERRKIDSSTIFLLFRLLICSLH